MQGGCRAFALATAHGHACEVDYTPLRPTEHLGHAHTVRCSVRSFGRMRCALRELCVRPRRWAGSDDADPAHRSSLGEGGIFPQGNVAQRSRRPSVRFRPRPDAVLPSLISAPTSFWVRCRDELHGQMDQFVRGRSLLDGDEAHDDGTNERVRAVRDIELLEDGGEVVLRGLGADVEPLRDLAVRGALGEQLQDFELPLGQRPRPPLPLVPVATGRRLRDRGSRRRRRRRGRLSSAWPARRACSRPGARSCRPRGRKPTPACRTSIRARSRPQAPATAARSATGSRLCLPFLPLIPPGPRSGAAPPHRNARWKLPGHCTLFASNDSRSTVAAGVRPAKNEQFSAVLRRGGSARVEGVPDRADDGAEDDDHDRRQEAQCEREQDLDRHLGRPLPGPLTALVPHLVGLRLQARDRSADRARRPARAPRRT